MTSNGSFISQAISWNMALNEGQRINASSTYLRGLAFILQNASQVWEIIKYEIFFVGLTES